VQLLEARDVVHRGDGVSAFCCASILHFGSKAEVDASYLMDHSVGAVLIGHIATSCSIQPQQRSKNSYKSVSPTWNQGFVFADAYPTARVLLAAAQAKSDRTVADDLRMPMDGNDVLLFLSLHMAGTDNTQDDLLGRATLPVQVLFRWLSPPT
jgi:hypothetical protein